MDDKLQDYKIIVEVFKGYLDTSLTAHTSYYAFTGLSQHITWLIVKSGLTLSIL